MSEMVERVARAIQSAKYHGMGMHLSAGKAEAIARAAIEAMREPTKAMSDIADQCDISDEIYQWMIDEALKP